MQIKTWRARLIAEPIYLRESGHWGTPNPFFDNSRRYVPLVVLLSLVPALCTSISNPTFLSQEGFIDDVLYCLLFLPMFGVTVFSWLGIYLAPAVTVPSLGMERQQRSWELLRLTPFSTSQIIMAKLLGSLKRLRIWPILLVLCFFQALIFGGALLANGEVVAGLLAGVALLFRPGLDIFFAGLVGVYLAMWIKSIPSALAMAYGMVIVVKIASSILTALVAGLLALVVNSSALVFALTLLVPMLLYLFLDVFGLMLLPGRAKHLTI